MRWARPARRTGALRTALTASLLCLGAAVRLLSAQDLATVRFTVSGAAAADSARQLGLDVVEIRPRDDRRVDLVAVVSPRERALLAARGWVAAAVPVSPAAAALEASRVARGAAAFTVYRDFDDPSRGLNAWLRAFAAARANVTVDSIGASVEGRPILAAKVGAANDDPARPNVIYLATYHAREWAATEMALRLLAYLADSLPLTPAGAALLAGRDVWVIPVVNPDGYQYSFAASRLWRKNRRPNADGSIGVDLNRNHSAYWGFDDAGSSPAPPAATFRGVAAASEPEVRAIEAFHRAHPPVASISYHTYTGAVLYPWAHVNGERTGDDAVFRALAGSDEAPAILDSLPGSINRYYHPGPVWHLYPTNGDYTEWAYRTFRTLAFTVELTSGCCDAGVPYGFDFPDSEVLLQRLVKDNLPFALGLLSASANITAATVAPGAAAPAPQFESVWPEVRVLLDVPAPSGGAAVDVATDSNVVGLTFAQRDTLGAGRRYVRLAVRDGLVAEARAVRLPIDGLQAEIVVRDGAERPDSPWRGFARATPGFEGRAAWHGFTDTLVSPAIAAAGRSGLSLYFWTRHSGSVFTQDRRGRVELSTDNGATWTVVASVVGAAPAWYPVQARLDAALAGAASFRLRFVALGLDWWLDAVTVTSSDAAAARLFSSLFGRRAPVVEVSANPVTAAPVTLRWPPGAGAARIDIFSLTGTRIAGAALPLDPGRWVWDLTTSDGLGAANGPYAVVVTLGDGSRLRRRLIVAR